MNCKPCIFPAACLLILVPMASAMSQKVVSGLAAGDEREQEKTRELQLHPAPAPVPALTYRLLPKFTDRRPGNAAVYYGKVTAEQSRFFGDYERLQKLWGLMDAPLEEVRDSKIAAQAVPKTIYHHLRLAALCRTCDWQIPIYDEPFYEILLPELQQTRLFGRLLAVRARYQVAHGQFEEAIETLQTGYAIACHDASGPTFIHALVALAIQTYMDEQVETMIQQPGAPNLYWALATLPQPLVDFRGAAEAEQNFIELSFPVLKDLSFDEAQRYTPEYWREQLTDLVAMMDLMMNGDWDARKEPVSANTAAMLMALQGYPVARRRLLESGMDSAVVERMSPAQAVVLEGVREFHEMNQDMLKWMYLPYHLADDGLDAAEDRMDRVETDGNSVLFLAPVLTPAIAPLNAAMVRGQRQTAVLQLLEAIRIYASETGGRVPVNLDDLTSAPAPMDPVTGKPFFYVREQPYRSASIRGPRLPHGPLDIKLQIVDEK